MHGRSRRRSGSGAPDVPATSPVPTAAVMPANPAARGFPEPPRAPGERTTSPGAMTGTIATLPHDAAGAAVVHLGRAGARVARLRAAGGPEIVSVPRRSRARSPEPYLHRILRAVGDRSPLVIGGLPDERTALERELVRVCHRPERFIEDPDLGPVDEALRGRLRALRSHPG